MARKNTDAPETDDGWKPTQAVSEPVINVPYEEPTAHWTYRGGVPQRMDGRRPASYYFKSRRTGGAASEDLFAEEQRDDLPLVNRLREDVRRWREAKDDPYRGASQVTKDLLLHWRRKDRNRRLFFCQMEAVETIIYLLEIAIPGQLSRTRYQNFKVEADNIERLLHGKRPDFGDEIPASEEMFPRLVDLPGDDGLLPLTRMACKMATGSGKTLVMAMLITWAFCNRGRNPQSAQFPNGILICAPNLTVRKRLQVLRADHPQNYYELFDLVPAKYRDLLNTGRVHITNWHAFALKSEHREGDSTYKVVDKGEETPDAFTKDRLGELASRLPILVLNDEGHHCWRPNPAGAKARAEADLSAEEKAALKEDAEEARIWLAGLDRMNNSGLLGPGQRCVLATVDLSATPFYLSNSGYPEGSPFPWVVSDFGLVDAIESGIVKIPRIPVLDDKDKKDDSGRPDPKFFRLWKHIGENLAPADKVRKRPKPEALFREAESALTTLAAQWKLRFDEIRAATPGESVVPPVMIVCCDNTELSQIVFEAISGERTVEVPTEDGKVEKRIIFEGSQILPELANSEGEGHTIRIDSKLLAKIETEGDETKDQAALALRDLIDTVGKRGCPGEHVRCVVSVSMLTEGWDANNVTHILGIRAFESQLLCEQVVGRGLRRMSYKPDEETGLLAAEYVDVYGIPFSLIPYKGRPKEKTESDPVYHHIYPVPERAAFELRAPVVESYTYDVRTSGIECDVSKLEPLFVDEEPTKVYLQVTRGYRDDADKHIESDFIEQNRDEYYRSVRFQQVLFRLTQMIVDDLIACAEGKGADALRASLLARHQIFPEILQIVQRYVQTKVRFKEGVDKRELGLRKYAQLLRERVRDGILPAASSESSPLLPVVNSYRPYVSTIDVSERTSRPVVSLAKSHLNLAAVHSTWEPDAIDVLEDLDCVECFVSNGRGFGFEIPYEYQGASHKYEPDFIVRLRGGLNLVLEIKGKKGELHEPDKVNAKNGAAIKWCEAVNNAKRYGRWKFDICREVGKLRSVLEGLAEGNSGGVEVLADAPPEDRFVTCLPVTSLRAAVRRARDGQATLDAVAPWATGWVRVSPDLNPCPGMFVARVHGDAMSPDVPAGAYCVFRPAVGDREGRVLLATHSAIIDPLTGGQYTVRRYASSRVASDAGDMLAVKLEATKATVLPISLQVKEHADVLAVAELTQVL
jgi:type III restriction enzyme